jgi:hypothetical protein
VKHCVLLTMVAALALNGAEDHWDKVRELKSGTELRIQKRNAAQPGNGTDGRGERGAHPCGREE